MNEELLALAEETQARHARLIAEAGRRESLEARSEVRNDLLALRSEFTTQALALTNVEAPFMWSPLDPAHAIALAVRGDIADTEERLARLAAGAALQKVIRTDFGSGMSIKLPTVTAPGALALGGLGVALILGAIFLLKR